MSVRGADPLLERLGLAPFRPRPPWWGPDLQTLHDTLRPVRLPPAAERGEELRLDLDDGEALLGLLDAPLSGARASGPRALVVLLHGLGGSSQADGVRRLGWSLQQAGFAVLRLNMRGAGAGRSLAHGTYAARCSRDMIPALARARQLAGGRPLLGVGLSLGGTVLLNAVLDGAGPLDGLTAVSSPLDLAGCSAAISRPRNRAYERWLLRRLRHQTLDDPLGLSENERRSLPAVASIRQFDALITAPRWGYDSVDQYYDQASPLPRLLAAARLPPTLLLQALDDPWVPASGAVSLASGGGSGDPARPLQVVLTPGGGHNGFHAPGGCWADRLVVRWLISRC